VTRKCKRTALYSRHKALGARMVEFAGWEMPVQYRGIREEHCAVRTAAALFDVSHMGQIQISGPSALAFCQKLMANDIAKIEPFQAQYTLLLNEQGGVIDDLIVYRLESERFLLCVNASRTNTDAGWLASWSTDGTSVVDMSDAYALLALQGPLAVTLLRRCTDVDLDAMESFHCALGEVSGVHCLLSRTGYTGEDGFELYCDMDRGPTLWDSLLEAGRSVNLEPAGLGARDTLRLEKGYPLYGCELDEQTTPLEAGLGWVVKLGKGPFLGREALLWQKKTGVRRRLVGLELLGAGIARKGYPILADGKQTGVVTSGTLSPTLRKAIALGYVSSDHAVVGQELWISIRGRQSEARVVKLPFV
jgi:aminomethyltransferase